MLEGAYSNGAGAAASQFGVKQGAWIPGPRLVGTSLGTLAGMGAAREDEKSQGALLGGLMGYGAGAGAAALGRGAASAGKWALPKLQELTVPKSVMRGEDLSALAMRKMKVPVGRGQNPQMVSGRQVFGPLPAKPPTPGFLGRLGGLFKGAGDLRPGLGIPGTPFGMGYSPTNERLPGMHKWVDRGVIERAHKGLDQGLSLEDVVDQERDRGRFTDPLLGAAAGAAFSHFGLKGNAGMSLLGAGLGAGAGALAHQQTGSVRANNMEEALQGVVRERAHEFPVRGQHRATATAATPLLISTGGGSL